MNNNKDENRLTKKRTTKTWTTTKTGNDKIRTKTKILRKRPLSGNCQLEDCFWQNRKINISHFFLVSEFGFKTYILMCAYWVADQKPYIFIPVSGLWSNLWSVPWACHTPWPGGPRLPQQGFFENRFTMFTLSIKELSTLSYAITNLVGAQRLGTDLITVTKLAAETWFNFHSSTTSASMKLLNLKVIHRTCITSKTNANNQQTTLSNIQKKMR